MGDMAKANHPGKIHKSLSIFCSVYQLCSSIAKYCSSVMTEVSSQYGTKFQPLGYKFRLLSNFKLDQGHNSCKKHSFLFIFQQKYSKFCIQLPFSIFFVKSATDLSSTPNFNRPFFISAAEYSASQQYWLAKAGKIIETSLNLQIACSGLKI